MADMANNIARDERHGVVAIWHDESQWNAYLFNHPPAKILPPEFMSFDE
jgi:hypothetical protein